MMDFLNIDNKIDKDVTSVVPTTTPVLSDGITIEV